MSRTVTGDSDFGSLLSRLRKEHGLSQAALADRMQSAGSTHWRQNTVSRVERGRQPVTMVELDHLKGIFGPEVMGALSPTLGKVTDRAAAELDRRAREAAPIALQAAQALYEYSGDPGDLPRIASSLEQALRVLRGPKEV